MRSAKREFLSASRVAGTTEGAFGRPRGRPLIETGEKRCSVLRSFDLLAGAVVLRPRGWEARSEASCVRVLCRRSRRTERLPIGRKPSKKRAALGCGQYLFRSGYMRESVHGEAGIFECLEEGEDGFAQVIV